MTIDKTRFQAVLDQLIIVQDATTLLGDNVDTADPENTFGALFSSIFGNLASVEAWANAKILEADQEQVMNDFLVEMKLVFDKYTAKIEVGTTTDGYGMDWGGATPNAGVRMTAMFGGVTATKEINKSVIVSGDLT